MKETQLYPGSFRPFHNRHLEIVQKIISDCPNINLILAISASTDDKKYNFISGQRAFELTSTVIKAECMENTVKLILIDKNDQKKCLELLTQENITTVYSGSQTTINYLKYLNKNGLWNGEIKEIPDIGIHGENIRKMIIEGNENWKNHVHPEIVNKIKEIGITDLGP